MLKAVIIDDERLARNELKKLLLEFPEVEVIGEAANAAEGLQKIEKSFSRSYFPGYSDAGQNGL